MTDERLSSFFETLEQMAAGAVHLRLPISRERDTLDTIAFGVNMMAGELELTNADLREARDAAIRMNEAKSAFLANLSHEIRTPMTAILGYIQLVSRFDYPKEKRQECLARAENSCRLLLRLVDDALDLARVESGNVTLEKTSFPLRSLLEEVLADLGSIASAKGLRTGLHISDGVPELLEADSLRLKQILINLVGNAIKFTAAGEVRIQVERRSGDVVIDVVDTGIGIDPKKASQLFQPFTQLDSALARRSGGAGLGLALSRRLAHLLGGEIELLQSLPNEGSTFRLSIPTTSSEADSARPRSPARPEPFTLSEALSGKNILFADDIPDNQIIIRTILEHAGAAVTTVDDGLALVDTARRAFGAQPAFDLVLIDLRMPGLSGYDAARRLREMDYRGPLVAISADALERERQSAREAGFDGFIAKPVDAHRLIRTVAAALESKR